MSDKNRTACAPAGQMITLVCECIYAYAMAEMQFNEYVRGMNRVTVGVIHFKACGAHRCGKNESRLVLIRRLVLGKNYN